MALDAEKEAAAAQEAAAKEAAEKAKAAAAGAQDAHADEDETDPAKVDPAKFKKMVEHKRELNAKLLKAEKANAEANAKLKAFEDEKEAKRVAGLAEVERERELRKKAEEKAAAAEQSAAKTARMSEVRLAGVGAEYVEIVEAQLEAAQKADPKLDISAWMLDRKARMPALFTATAAEKAAGGPQRSGMSNPQIEELELAVKKATGSDRVWAERALRKAKEQLAAK